MKKILKLLLLNLAIMLLLINDVYAVGAKTHRDDDSYDMVHTVDRPKITPVPPMIPTVDSTKTMVPQPGKALVIFVREPAPNRRDQIFDPSLKPWYQTNALFPWDTNPPALFADHDFIGIAYPQSRLSYQAHPGKHEFMMVADDADFMSANLLPGKTYYVILHREKFETAKDKQLVGQFRFQPQNGQLSQDRLHQYLQYSTPIYFSQAQRDWFHDNALQFAKIESLDKPLWDKKIKSDKATLFSTSGVIVAADAACQQLQTEKATTLPYRSQLAPGMMPVHDSQGDHVPRSGKTLVIFMRTDLYCQHHDHHHRQSDHEKAHYPWDPIQPILLDNRRFIGVMYPYSRLSYQVGPGEHFFMLSANDADFLPAILEAGKVYYIKVAYTECQPGGGGIFRFEPQHGVKDKVMIKTWLQDTVAQRVTPEQVDWFKHRIEKILETETVNLPHWQQISAKHRPMVYPGDGVLPSPYTDGC